MKKHNNWELLRLFGADSLGETQEQSAPTPQTTNTGDTAETCTPAAGESKEEKPRAEDFRALMEGAYKDHFTAYFQETFNRRFKEQKEMKAELERANALIDAAAAHFGVAREALSDTIRAENEKKRASADGAGDNIPPTPKEERADEETVKKAVAMAVAAAKAETERALLADIRARGLRPAESALSEGHGDALRGQGGRLSKAQRAEVARRAAKGERIRF